MHALRGLYIVKLLCIFVQNVRTARTSLSRIIISPRQLSIHISILNTHWPLPTFVPIVGKQCLKRDYLKYNLFKIERYSLTYKYV